jgi:hypothetical protein
MAQVAKQPSMDDVLRSADPNALAVIERDLSSGTLSPQFEDAVRKLPRQAQLQLEKELEAQHNASPDKERERQEFMQDMLETGTLTGEAKKLGRAVLKGAIEVGEFIDRFTGAPTRAAIGAAQEGRFLDVPQEFLGQFVEDPSEAPTGKELASRMGFSREESLKLPVVGKVSPAGVAGFAADVLFDWSNIIPVAAVGKAIKAGAKAGPKAIGELAVEGSKKALRAAEQFPPTRKAAEVLKANFKATRAPDFQELQEIADKIGVDKNILPPAAEFGKQSVITRALRTKAEGPMGEELLRNHDKVIRQTNMALTDTINNIAKGPIMSREEAGMAIREYFQDAMSKTFDDLEFNNAKIGSVIKERLGVTNLNLSSILPPERMQKWEELISSKLRTLERIIAESPSPAKVTEAKLTKDALLKLDPNLEINRFISQFQTIGSEAFGKRPVVFGQPGPDYSMLKDIYFDSRDLVLDAADGVLDKETLLAIAVQNKMVSEFFKNSEPIRKVVLNHEIPPEKLFGSLVENIDSLKKKSMESLFTPDQMDALKGTYLQSIASKSKTQDGLLSFAKFKNALSRNDKTGFVLDQTDIDQLEEILRFGDRMGIPIMSTSGTGASFKFTDIPRNIAAQLSDDVVIESLVRMARGEKDVVSKAVSGGAREFAEAITGVSRTGGPKGVSLTRGPKEKVGKGLQSISVQTQEEDNPISRALRLRRR